MINLQHNINTQIMKITFRFFLLLAALSGFMLSGCEPVDNSTTGDDPRDPYVGVWQFIESKKSTEGQSYIVTISKDPANSSQVLLENFGNPGTQEAAVTGIVTANQIAISSQSLSNGWIVEGSGKISNADKTKMTWTYSITAGGDKEFYTATATSL
jgi:hypothetical protein